MIKEIFLYIGEAAVPGANGNGFFAKRVRPFREKTAPSWRKHSIQWADLPATNPALFRAGGFAWRYRATV